MHVCSPSGLRLRRNARGNAMAETIVGLLALAPFIAGVPLLGKQLDVKHKTFDAARYSIWERTVWRNDAGRNRKSDAEIMLETRDRTLGDPRSGMLAVSALQTQGVSENPLWRDHRRERLLDYESDQPPLSVTHDERASPVDVGYLLAPGIAYGEGPLSAVAVTLQVSDLGLNRRAFSNTSVAIGLRPVLSLIADQPRTLGARNGVASQHAQLLQQASAAILSDTWSSHDEGHFGARVDNLTTDELIESLELPGRVIGLQALGRGEPLYGEGQFGWRPDLRPRSSTLPARYVGAR